MGKTAVLLINLGTPDEPSYAAVHRYLIEFLTDPRVIDFPWFKRQVLVRTLIVPLRCKNSTHSYRTIWKKEGSPLLYYSQEVKRLLQSSLGENYHVELAMRYQNPSIKEGLKSLLEKKPEKLIILPLFPQYASATTGSVYEKVMQELSFYQILPKIEFIDQFYNHHAYIDAHVEVAKEYSLDKFDHILFSFHGLPERQLKKGNSECITQGCCQKRSQNNCYAHQCFENATLIANKLQLSPQKYSICFQSRLGKEPWIGPNTSDSLTSLAQNGKKKIAVFCPSFVADCLETLYEIDVEYQEVFKHHGGEKLQLIPSLNAHPAWVDALKQLLVR